MKTRSGVKLLKHDSYKGIEYAIGHNHWGNGVGYVRVPNDHLLFELDYNDSWYDCLDVHGGLTYADKLCPLDDGFDPANQEWWIGFDFGHAGDLPMKDYTPIDNIERMKLYGNWGEDREPTIDDIEKECLTLAKFLHETDLANSSIK